MENNKGIVFLPYKMVTKSTSINGETVWYRNKFKNFLLKLKWLVIKPKYLKNKNLWTKKINTKFYQEIKTK